MTLIIIIGMLSSSLITILILMCFRNMNKKDVKLDEVPDQQVFARQKHLRGHSNMAMMSSINDTVMENEILTGRRSDEENTTRKQQSLYMKKLAEIHLKQQEMLIQELSIGIEPSVLDISPIVPNDHLRFIGDPHSIPEENEDEEHENEGPPRLIERIRARNPTNNREPTNRNHPARVSQVPSSFNAFEP